MKCSLDFALKNILITEASKNLAVCFTVAALLYCVLYVDSIPTWFEMD
jgi:hypothetical protein